LLTGLLVTLSPLYCVNSAGADQVARPLAHPPVRKPPAAKADRRAAAASGAAPFVLATSGQDRERAERCLAQAVYYEAGDQPLEGQAAVAQTVINRLRHPAFPKSVCGVVFEGARLPTGCQYSFTCDGALARKPDIAGWSRALMVARRALSGYVETSVGLATHYHADYVSPAWAPTLVRLTQIGPHIFYRWRGQAGAPTAFVGRYAGHEATLAPALLSERARRALGGRAAQPTARKVTLVIDDHRETHAVEGVPPAEGGLPGALTPSRPRPSAVQVAQVNAFLASAQGGAAAEVR